MENLLFLLKSIGSTWLSTSSTSWAVDMILACACGLVLFILLIPFLDSNPSFPSTGKENNRKMFPEVLEPTKFFVLAYLLPDILCAPMTAAVPRRFPAASSASAGKQHHMKKKGWERNRKNCILKASYTSSLETSDPMSSLMEMPQAEAGRGDHSFIHPDVQKLLEMLISEKVKQKMCQEKQQGGSFFQPLNTDYPRASLSNLLRLLGDKLTSARPFCSTKAKPAWLLGPPQQPSIPKVLGSPLEHERSLLFWGLPSLHSESLVATAWVTKRSSSSRSQSIKFNEAPTHIPGQSLWNLPPFLPYAQPQAQVPCFPPKPQSTSPSQVRVCGTTCSTSQKKAQSFLPKENQDLEWTLQKPQKWRKALDTKLQKAQEPISLPMLNLPQGGLASKAPWSAFVPSGDSPSTELQQKPECHRPQGFNREDQTESLPHPTFRFYSLMQPLGKLPRKGQGQAQDSHEPTQNTKHSVPTCSNSRGSQMTESWHSGRDFNKGLITLNPEEKSNVSPEASKDKKDMYQIVGSALPKGTESGIICPEEYGSGGHFSRSPGQKVLGKCLQVHLSRKLGQINEGMIPVCVRRSCFTAKQALPELNTISQPTKITCSKSGEVCVNTPQELAFPNPTTQMLLEAHIKKCGLRHEQETPFQNVEHRNISVTTAQALPAPQPALDSTACDTRADFIAKLATFEEDIPEKVPGKREITTQTLCLTLESPLPATRQPACEEVQKSSTGTPSDHANGPSDITPTAKGVVLPSAACTLQSSTVLETKTDSSPVPTPGPAVAKRDPGEGTGRMAFRGTCHSIPMLEIKLLSPLSVAKESRNLEVEEKQPAWEVTVGASMMENAQNINISLRTLGSQDTGNHSCSSDQTPSGRRKVDSHPDINMHGDRENRSHDVSTGSLRESHTEAPLSTGTCPSPASLANSQYTPHSNTPTPQFLCDHSVNAASSQGQHEPSMSGFQDTEKSSSKLSEPTNQSKNYRKPRPGDEEQTLAGERPSHSCELSPLEQVREVDTPGSKSSPCLPEKDQASKESLINRNMKHFQEYLNPNKQCKEQEDFMQKPKSSSAIAQSRTSVTNRVVRNREDTNSQVLLTAIGQILVEKLGLHHGRAASDLNSCKAEPPESVGRRSCYHRLPSSPEKRTMVKDVACAHDDSPRDHSCPTKRRWVTDRFSNQALLPQKPVPPTSHGLQRSTGRGASDYLHHHPTSSFHRVIFSKIQQKLPHAISSEEIVFAEEIY
ncbi:spermatogenesis-associated protein 31E1-like [Octodon degus]|uniref:Spermatogenesis-associated protein 31E1-like n=1 Tax=Octodon degus TaxID=10160 RepID=A0A6P3VDH6_OCTDE|nr:spermatogenesis-associated protein 31E1-like [Octodon degus]